MLAGRGYRQSQAAMTAVCSTPASLETMNFTKIFDMTL